MGFVLDRESGTFVRTPDDNEVREVRKSASKPLENAVDIVKKDQPNIVGGSSPGMPGEKTETFRTLTDLSVFQVDDRQTGKPLCIISGYALQIKFNRDAITCAADVEQAAEGLKKMFYNIIMDQLLEED